VINFTTDTKETNDLPLAPADAQTMYAGERAKGGESPLIAECEGEYRDGELDDFVDLGLGTPPYLKAGPLYPEQQSAIEYALKHTQINMGAHEQLTYVEAALDL
jgi:hypothetical protein